MKTKWSSIAYSSIALIFVAISPAFGQVDLGPATAEGTIEGGAIPQSVPFNDVGKYQEYRDLAQQFIVPQLRFLLGDKEENYYVRFDGVNLAQRNQMYNLRFGEYGKLDVQAQYVEIPHVFSNDTAQTSFQYNNGNFTLPTRPNTYPHDFHTLDMSLLEGVSNVNIRYTPVVDWSILGNFNYQNPTGENPYGSSWVMAASPGGSITELWVPTQYHTYNFGTGVEYSHNGWLGSLQYQGSIFHDSESTLTWDNANPSLTNPCHDTLTTPCRGRASMYPDNSAHNFIATGAGELPFNTRVMGNFEYGMWFQDANFIPFTINSQPTLQQKLPYNSLGGDVRPTNVNLTVVSNPFEPLDMKASYTYFNYDNRDSKLAFNNVKSLNDVSSTWSATPFPFSYSVQNINLEPTYRITENLAAHMMGRISTYHNDGMMVLQQDETAYGPALDYTPFSWLTLRTDYQHAYRSSPGYNNNRPSLVAQAAGGAEIDALRRFDEAQVHVDQTSFYAQAQPNEKLGLFASFSYDNYGYPGSDLGLQHSSSYSPSFGASYEPLQDVHFFGDYEWAAYDWNLRSMQRTTDSQTPQNLPNAVWNSTGRNQANNINVGMDVVIPKNIIPAIVKPSHFKLQYTYTCGNASIHNRGDSQNPANFHVTYPDAGTQQHELMVRYEYWVSDNFSVNIGYYFNHFGENDYAVDNMQPIMKAPYTTPANSVFLGNTSMDPYNANVGFLTLQYKF